MAQKRNVDVIVPVVRGDLAVLGRLRKILDLSGPALERLLLIDDGCAERELAEGLNGLVATESRIHHLRCARNLGWVEHCNRGLLERRGDVALLDAEAVVSEGWLDGLAEAAHSEERTALAAPVVVDAADWEIDEADVRRAVEGLPRWTSTPRAGGGCCYLRGDVLDAVGLLDPTFKTASAALDDWLMRARSLGFFAKRANHVFLFCGEDRKTRLDAAADPVELAALEARHGCLAGQAGRFERSLDASLARHAIEFQASGRLRVAYDVRHLPLEQNGTKMYAISLGKALAAIPELDLTLLAAHPIQAEGVPGRIVSPDEWADDVAVIHKPAQIFDRRHARLLFESRAHVVVTYQDLIAYRLPGVFATEDDYNAYQNTSRLTLQAVQGILAYSQCTAREIADEFGIPVDEVSPIFLGVDVDSFGAPVAEADEIRARLNLPSRYFLSLASDYPHKNLAGLLEAYALFRHWWRDGEPPALVLAGNAPRTTAIAKETPGVRFLGAVSDLELKVLYQDAEALVFPSVYEGFGLPPLEAMATGSPVVAMPFSSVPEVCDAAALYADGLSPIDLARAMQRLAVDEDLRTELAEKGRRRIEALHWQATARATFEVYRKTVMNPSIRSLQMRRSLQEAIALWAEPIPPAIIMPAPPPAPPVIQIVRVVQEPEPLGIINACNDLNAAVRKRLKRELKRLANRRSA